MINTRNLELAF